MEGQRRSKVAQMTSKAEDDDRKDKGMTTRLQEQRRREENLCAVLNNHVVCENIVSHLSLDDMKAASEVSCQFLQAIRGTRRFTQTTVLAITDENLEDMQSFKRMTDYKWRGVKVDVTDPTNILEDLRRVLKSAEFVSLEGRPWMTEDRAVKDFTAVSFLTAVLSSTRNLSQLKIDVCFLLLSDVRRVFLSPAVQQTLRNLNSLKWVRKTELNCPWGHPPRYFTNSEDEEMFMMNFDLCTGFSNRLKCFKLTLATPIEKEIISCVTYYVLRLLQNNKATLEELELHLSAWWFQKLQTLSLPALKTLTASVDIFSDGETLGEFLKNHNRSLEELTLTSVPWNVAEPNSHLCTGIKECSVGLKKLHLTGRSLSQFDWSFLALMNRLKDFRLNSWTGFEEGDNLLAFLPKDQLECLSLEGLWDKWKRPLGFWSAGRVVPELAVKKQLLQGFRCLRKLSFLGSRDAVDDQLMQWLLKEFSLLEEFQLSYCSTLTDAGISGNTTAEWGRDASFADLRRLKTLKIVKCRRVTPNGVLASCVNVPSLRSLEYTNPPGPVVESVVLELVRRNPRLERLSLHCYGDLGNLRAKIMKKNPRVELSLVLVYEEDDG